MVGAGHLGRKKPRERQLGWGRGLAVVGSLTRLGWKRGGGKTYKPDEKGLEIATSLAGGEEPKEGKGVPRRKWGGGRNPTGRLRLPPPFDKGG